MSDNNPFKASFNCGDWNYDFDVREYIPDGYAVVDRARLERLIARVKGDRPYWWDDPVEFDLEPGDFDLP